MPVRKYTPIVKQVNGVSIKADVFLPASGYPPVVLFLHGGALISGSRRYLPGYQARRLVQAGFAVVSCDYRLAPETLLEDILCDIQDAIRWVKGQGADEFPFDPSRVAVMGSSAGGYLSLMSGTFAVRPKAIVSFYGYGDILGDWYTRPSAFYCQRPLISRAEALSSIGRREKSSGGYSRFTFYFYCRQQGTWPQVVSGFDPATDPQAIRRFCPVEHIDSTYPPVLLLHGDQDMDVPYEQSQQMAAALTGKGIENRLITIPGGGHGFDGDGKNPQVQQVFEEVVQFLQAHLA